MSADAHCPSWPAAGGQRPSVVIIAAANRALVSGALQRLEPVIAAGAEIAVVDLEFKYDFGDGQHDLVIVLGGDGSILQAARQMGEHQLPVLGVNCGQLGFLAALSPDAFLESWPQVAAGHFDVVEHLMLRTVLIRDGEEVDQQLSLNETAVLGGPPYSIMDIDMYVDGLLATTYRCDGLIISTPVGSTAHNLSAGGPILRKDLQAIVVSPISPHTLTHRSVVDSAERVFELTVSNPNASTTVVTDGRVMDQVRSGDRILVRRSSESFKMISVPGQNDYRTLREKLGWGGNAFSNPG
jgi:NAD+ kinase